jgi:hypothetical protein
MVTENSLIGATVGDLFALPRATMPTILRVDGYRFFFFSNERNEPPHVHVESGDRLAKLWLETAEVVFAVGFRPSELATLRRLVILNRTTFEERWYEYFGRWNRGSRSPRER